MIQQRNRWGAAIGLAAMLALASCSQDELAEQGTALPDGQYPLQIASVTLSVESSGQPWMRVSESADGTGSVWTAGDEFYAKPAGATEAGTFQIGEGNSVTALTTTYWTKATETVTAWYPANGTVSLADQSKGLAYVLQATAQNASYNSSVSLTFTHQLAKVRVALEGNKADDVDDVKIWSYTSCTNSQGTVSTDGASEGWITMNPATYNGTTYWEANVVPGYPITRFKVNDAEGTLTQTVTPEAGKWHEITISVEGDPGYTIDADGTYQVYTAEGLQAWASHVNQGNWSTNCTLTADITLTGTNNWTPVGTNLYSYSGTFDGAGYTISGMNIASSTYGQGLISYLSGTVKNLTITNALVSGSNSIGGIVGQANAGSSITGCTFSGKVSASQHQVGGIVGIATGCTITGCSASGTVTASQSDAGGIVGYSSNSNFTACWSTAGATATMYGAGCIAGSSSGTSYTACYWQNASMENWGEGVGDTGEPVEVTGSDWSAAMSAMNSALANAGYTGYQWTENTGSDKEDVPLVLVSE